MASPVGHRQHDLLDFGDSHRESEPVVKKVLFVGKQRGGKLVMIGAIVGLCLISLGAGFLISRIAVDKNQKGLIENPAKKKEASITSSSKKVHNPKPPEPAPVPEPQVDPIAEKKMERDRQIAKVFKTEKQNLVKFDAEVFYKQAEVTRLPLATIFQVIDEKNVLIRLAPFKGRREEFVWIGGIATKGMKERFPFRSQDRVFLHLCFREYRNELGGLRTVRFLIPQDAGMQPTLEEFRDALDRGLPGIILPE
jgi:hypothetical protein